MSEVNLKEALLKFIKEKAVVKGEVELASGQKSDFYIDGKLVTLDPQGIFLVSKVIFSLIHGTQADAIGGPTLGADPIAAAVALLSSQSGHALKAFIVRKEAKGHGMQKMIEGPVIQEGDRVVIVEDVITTGGSVLKAIKEVEKTKAKVVRVISLIDRGEGAIESLSTYNYTPIFELKELGIA